MQKFFKIATNTVALITAVLIIIYVIYVAILNVRTSTSFHTNAQLLNCKTQIYLKTDKTYKETTSFCNNKYL